MVYGGLTLFALTNWAVGYASPGRLLLESRFVQENKLRSILIERLSLPDNTQLVTLWPNKFTSLMYNFLLFQNP